MLVKLNRFVHRCLYWTTAGTCALFLVMVLLSVLTRYVFKSPLLGSVELSRIFFLWSCFTGAALCYRQQSHIAITFLTDRLPPRLSRLLSVGLYAFQLPFLFVLGYSSIQVVNLLYPTELPMLNASQALLYLPVPVCVLCLVLFCLEFMIENIRGKPVNL